MKLLTNANFNWLHQALGEALGGGECALNFGKFLKQLRESRHLSIRELAKRSNVSFAHISQIEAGQRGTPKPETIRKLAEGLHCPVDQLMEKAGYLSQAAPDQDQSSEHIFFFNLEGLSEAEIEEVRQHIEFLRWRAKQNETNK